MYGACRNRAATFAKALTPLWMAMVATAPALSRTLLWLISTHQASNFALEHLLDRGVGTAPVTVLAEPKGLHAVKNAEIVSLLVAGQQDSSMPCQQLGRMVSQASDLEMQVRHLRSLHKER